MFDESNENLPYLFSARTSEGPQRNINPDEADLGTLVRLEKLLDSQISTYLTIDSVTTDEQTFSVKQQLAINQKVVGHLRELKLLVESAIDEVKEV